MINGEALRADARHWFNVAAALPDDTTNKVLAVVCSAIYEVGAQIIIRLDLILKSMNEED